MEIRPTDIKHLAAVEHSREVLQVHGDYQTFLNTLSACTGPKAEFARLVLEWRLDEHRAPRLSTFLHAVFRGAAQTRGFLSDLTELITLDRRIVVDWFDDDGLPLPRTDVRARPQLFFTGEDGPSDWKELLDVMFLYDHRMAEYEAWLARAEGQDEDKGVA